MIICGRHIKVRGRFVRVASPELDKYESLDDPEALISCLQKSGKRIDLLTFMQHMPDTTPKYSYFMEWDNLALLEVSTLDHWWSHQIRSFARNRARQAGKKGVTLRVVPFDDALVEGMREVYNESPVRQGKPNVHYGKDLPTVRQEEATFLDRSVFIGAFLGSQLIGFAKLVTNGNATQANLMNIVAMVRHRDKAPTNALIAEAVRVCAERGIRHLAYQNFTYGNRRPDSLSQFKEVNGFRQVDLPRYYIPLTLPGRIALRLGLHHRLIDRFPEPIAARFRMLRNAWYNRKFQSAPQPS